MMNSGSTTRRTDPPPTPAPPAPPVGRNPDPTPPPPSTSLAGELREIDEKMRAGLAAEDYRGITALLDDARKRHGTPEWLSDIDLRIPQVLGRARRNSLPLRDKGVEAQKRKDAAEIKALKEKIAAWGFPVLVEEFDKALADAATAPPPPPPPPPPVDPNAPPFVLYDDALAPGVRNHSWLSTVDLASTRKPHEGSKSIAWAVQKPWAGLYLQWDKDLEPAEYPYISFWLCPNYESFQATVTLWGKANAGSAQFNFNNLGGLPKAGQWKNYVIPTADFHPVGNIVHAFVLQADRVTNDPLFYVDQIRFIRAAEDKAAPPPPPPPPPADPLGGKWGQAALKAAARDYDGALKLVDDPADAELLKLAAQVPAEAGKLIDKWAKGQKVRFEYVGSAGDRVLAEGAVLTADAVKVSISREDGPLDVPVSEFTPGTLADLFRGRPDRKPQDARGAAAFCALEGDVDGAKSAAIPEKYLAFAQKRSGPSEAEAAARRLFWTAESEFSSLRRRGAAVEKYSTLLAGSEVPRLRPYATARLEAAEDSVFLADDLSGRGSFAPSGNSKIDVYWSSNADSAPSKAKENYVEAEFNALPGSVYRAWVWAGGCCQETFDASWQATELTTPNPKNSKEPLACEPGSDLAPALKMPASLRKWHAQHGGPKEPAKWEWIRSRSRSTRPPARSASASSPRSRASRSRPSRSAPPAATPPPPRR